MYERFKGAAGHLLVILFFWSWVGVDAIHDGEYRMAFAWFLISTFFWGWWWEYSKTNH